MMGYFNPIVSRLMKRLTCLASHVGGDGEGGPDGRVGGKEEHPEDHASPHCQVRELPEKQRLRDRKERWREVGDPDTRLIRISLSLPPRPRSL